MRQLLPLTLLLVGCGSSGDFLANRTGRPVTVRVRPDMLGMSGTLPASVKTDSLNGADLTISGKLVASDESWVTLEEGNGSETMIARDAITSVTVRTGEPASTGIAVPNPG